MRGTTHEVAMLTDVTMTVSLKNGMLLKLHNLAICVKVRGPFVQTLCIEKDSYMDAI